MKNDEMGNPRSGLDADSPNASGPSASSPNVGVADQSGSAGSVKDGDKDVPTWARKMNPVVRHVVLQFLGFGVIGFLCFFIDWGFLNIFVAAFHMNPTVSGTLSFLLSLIVNYIASMKFVFIHRADMARWMELVIFLICSVIGLIINAIIIALMTQPFMGTRSRGFIILMTNIAKIIATIIVGVWNFFSRKFTIDAPRVGHENDNTFAHRIGVWSLEHGPSKWQRPQGAPDMASALLTADSFSSKLALPADPVSLPFYEIRVASGMGIREAAEEAAIVTRGISRKFKDRQQAMDTVARMLPCELTVTPVDPVTNASSRNASSSTR